MTQAEINAQPAWLLATETKIGTAIVLVGLAIATGGTGDVGVEGLKVVEKAGEDGEVAFEYPVQGGANNIEAIATDEIVTNYFETDVIWEEVDLPQIVDVEVYTDDFGNFEIYENGELVRIQKPFNAYSIFGKISKGPPVA